MEAEHSDSYDIPTDFDDEQSDVDSTKQTEEDSMIKSEVSVEQNSFSVPVENSIAIITIPTLNEIDTKPSAEVESLKKEEITESINDKIEDTANISIQSAKKRRGRQPLAASTAKKTKLSPTKVTKEESSPKKYNLRNSSRESSVESNKNSRITKSITLPTQEPTSTRRGSSSEKLLKAAIEKTLESKNKKVTRVQELKCNKKGSSALLTSSESSLSSTSDFEQNNMKGRDRPLRKAKLRRGSTQKITNFFKAGSNVDTEPIEDVASNDEQSPGAAKINGHRQSIARIQRKVLYDSDSDSECEPLVNYNKQSELKSITSNDFNSQTQSSILARYDYLNKSSPSFADKQPKNKKSVISDSLILDELKDFVDKSKVIDPTYSMPPNNVKRPYLRTSAFKGNHINSDDSSNHTDSCTRTLSVSCDDSSIITNINDNEKKNNCLQSTVTDLGIKDRMKELIKKQKEKINSVPTSSEISKTDPKSFQKNNDKIKKKKVEPVPRMSSVILKGLRRKPDTDELNRKTFKQEEVEKPIEKLVCYEEILEAIRITDPSRKNGRASSMIKPLETAKKNELKKQLTNLEHFKCGNCNNLVTKHKWKDHLMDHGGMAWIETFESPIDIKDWNESVRRLNNYMRIYKLESYQCPNCGCDKKSALGHLSHIYICGESVETIEERKYACEFCDEKVLPFNMSWHKRKCTALNDKKVKVIADDRDDEQENDDGNSRSSSTQDGGRAKRKAGKK